MDEPVPHIEVETLRPTPFRRRVQSLKETSRKVVNKVKEKWNDFYKYTIGLLTTSLHPYELIQVQL